MLWFKPQTNSVKEAKLILKERGLIPEKEFKFSDELIQILKQKLSGTYKAPPYKFIRDARENDFAKGS